MSLKNTLQSYDRTPPVDPNNIKNFLTKYEDSAEYDNSFNQYADYLDADFDDTQFYSDSPYNNDYLDGSESELGNLDLDEYRAQSQSASSKWARGLGRVANETIMNVLEIPGVVIGGVAGVGNEIFGDGEGSLDMMVNNWWINMLEKEKDWFNTDAAPVYVKKSVQNGNLWDNISSVDFWATDGASGLAFMASALAPGYGIKALGTGAKLANALGKSKKLMDGTKVLSKVDDIAKAVGLGNTANATDILASTVANTMFEAGIEAKGAMDSYQQELDHLINNEEITEGQYLELSQQRANQGAKVFKDNMGILLLPNLIMSKALIGKAIPSKQLNKFKVDGSKITPNLQKLSLKDKLINGTKLLGQATASEGLLEEAGQMTSEKMRTSGFLDEQLGKESKSWTETYMDVLGSTEGQKAIFLGSFFGTGATAIGKNRQNKADLTRREELADIMTNGVNFFENATEGIYKKDEDNNIVFENGKPVVDQEKLINLGESMDFLQDLTKRKEEMVALDNMGVKGAKQYADLIDHNIVNNMLYSFVHAEDEGIAVLKNYLENSSGLNNLVDTVNAGKEIKQSKDEIISGLIKEANDLKEDLSFYSNYGEFKNELYKTSDDVNFYPEFSKVTKNKYLSSQSNLRYLQKRESELNNALNKATEDFIKYSKIKDDKDVNYVEQSDVIKSIQEDIDNNNILQNDINKELKKLLNPKIQQKEFNKFKKNKEALKKAEEDSIEVDSILKQILETKNQEDLNKIKDNPLYSKYKEQIDSKITEQELKLKKSQEVEAANVNSQTQKQSDNLQTEVDDYNEELESIGENFNVGETIILPESFGENAGKTGIIAEIKKSKKGNVRVLFDVEGVEDFVPYYQEVSVKPTEATTNTEGSLDENLITHNEDASESKVDQQEDSAKDLRPASDVKIMSTNVKNGQLLPGLSESLLEFERNPIDKIGTKVTFDINTEVPKDHPKLVEINKALDLYNKYLNEDISDNDLYHMIDYLPIKLKINNSDALYSYLETRPAAGSKEGSFDIFRNRTRPVRTNIINHLKEGGNISDIYTTIVGQYGGVLQLDNYAQNSILDLQYINKDIKNVELFTLNENGELVDAVGNLAPGWVKSKSNWKGSLYVKIKKANGKDFYLHSNFAKVSKNQAEIIYDIYKELLDNPALKPLSKLEDLTDNSQNLIKQYLNSELILIKKVTNKNFKDVTISELLDLIFWDGSKSVKSRLNINKGSLNFGKNSVYKNKLTEETKEEFIDWVIKNKNRNIKFKSKSNDINKTMNTTNVDYLKYILENKILHTNAKVNEPSFGGFTNMYMNTTTNIDSNNSTYDQNSAPKVEEVSAEEMSNAQEAETFNFGDVTKKDIKKSENISSGQEKLVSLQDKVGTEENKKPISRTRGKKVVTMRERKARARKNGNNDLNTKC